VSMATSSSKPDIEITDFHSGDSTPAWPPQEGGETGILSISSSKGSTQKASPQDALQALLAFSSLHDQIRRRKALATRNSTFDSPVAIAPEFEPAELFVLDEVLQLVAERALSITGADGLAIALAENNEIVLRAAAGTVRPDVGTRIDRDSAFSGACFRTAQIINCDDTETDSRVNLQACRKMGARSMVAVPLCGRKRVIGVLEAFSAWPFAFNEIDVRNLSLLAELVLGALKPEDEDRFAQSAQIAAAQLETPKLNVPKLEPPKIAEPLKIETSKPPAPRLEARIEAARIEAARAEAARIEAAKLEAARNEAAKIEAAKSEPSKPVLTPAAPTLPNALKNPLPPKPVPAPSVPKTPSAEIPKSVSPVEAAPSTSAAASPVIKPVLPELAKSVQPQVPATVAGTSATQSIRPTPVSQPGKPAEPTAKPVTSSIAPAAPVATPSVPQAPPQAPIAVTSTPSILLPEDIKKNELKENEESKPHQQKKTEVAKEAAQAEAVAEPSVSFGQASAEASNRPWLLVMLIGTVIAAAFIAGVWWKLKNAQIGGAMVQNQPQTALSSPPVSQPKAAVPAVAIPSTNSPAETDSLSSNQPEDAPATPQELSKFPRVTGLRHWSSADSSTVVLDLEDQVQYEPGHITNPERFYFDLRDTQLAPELQGKSLDGDSLLSRIRIGQPVSGMTRIVLEARPNATLAAPQVSLERDPYRLVIQVSKAGTTPKGAVNLFPKAPESEKAKLAVVVPPPTKEDLQLRAHVAKMRIVVDAGHGGWDLGTVGRRGLLEKDLVLEIAQRLGKLLESRLGAEVIYTRQDDTYLPLDDRAVVANQAQADLFISVHANYSDMPSARGVETYYTNFFSAPGSKELPANATPKEIAMRSMPKNIPTPALSATELHEKIEQSRRLATSVQRSLYGTLSLLNPGLRDRGIKEAGFVVLTESAMPGILAEVSFVSSPTDEQKLRSDMYREQIAEALYHGIARYAAASKTVKVATK